MDNTFEESGPSSRETNPTGTIDQFLDEAADHEKKMFINLGLTALGVLAAGLYEPNPGTAQIYHTIHNAIPAEALPSLFWGGATAAIAGGLRAAFEFSKSRIARDEADWSFERRLAAAKQAREERAKR